MIEAVNASIVTAPITRALTEDASTAQSANPDRVQKAAIIAPYLSPHVRLSPNSKPVFVVRDAATGAQIKQFPTEAQIRAYQKAGEAKSQIQTQELDGQQKTITPEEAKAVIKSSVQYKEERAAVEYKEQVAVPGKPSESSASEAAPLTIKTTFDEKA